MQRKLREIIVKDWDILHDHGIPTQCDWLKVLPLANLFTT